MVKKVILLNRLSSSPFLSVIIPAYNEENRIGRTIQKVREYLENVSLSAEVVVVCDGCVDRTSEIVQNKLTNSNLDFKLIEYFKNRGKGEALKIGNRHANGLYRVCFDADLATPITMIDRLKPHFQQNIPVIVGTRKHPQSSIKEEQPVHRKVLGWVFTIFSNLIVHKSISDFTCGFKAFRADAASELPKFLLPRKSKDLRTILKSFFWLRSLSIQFRKYPFIGPTDPKVLLIP